MNYLLGSDLIIIEQCFRLRPPPPKKKKKLVHILLIFQMEAKSTSRGLTAVERLFFYGMHGLFDEIVFTALYDVIYEPEGNRQLKGYSTIFSFFIYGVCSYMVERMYVRLKEVGIPFEVRIFIYLVVLYSWEFSCGLVLRQFDACSWDYSHYRFNIMGLITLEYAIFWLPLCAWNDVLYKYLLSLKLPRHNIHEKLT